MAKPYDPKLNPNKSLEETIENFIAWIRTSNRGTASVLRNISDKLLDISKTEENLKTLEISQEESLKQIKELLTIVSNLSSTDSDQNESTDHEIQNSLDVITSQLKQLANSNKTNHEEMQSEITLSMNRLEGVILDIKSDIIAINSQLHIQSEKAESTAISDRNIQQELTKIREQIICKTEQDKATILGIIDGLISHLNNKLLVEITGIELKKQLVQARTQVYEKTEGLAPRFRKMMDNLMESINDETLYSRTTLELILIEGLRFIREIYNSAPVGQHDI